MVNLVARSASSSRDFGGLGVFTLAVAVLRGRGTGSTVAYLKPRRLMRWSKVTRKMPR